MPGPRSSAGSPADDAARAGDRERRLPARRRGTGPPARTSTSTSTTLEVPVDRAWAAVRAYVEDLVARGSESRLTGLLATDPPAGFAVAAEQAPHLLSLAGRHRFSDYVLDLRVAAHDSTAGRLPGDRGDLRRLPGAARPRLPRRRHRVARPRRRGPPDPGRDPGARVSEPVTGRWRKPTITGERVTLRPVTADDADGLWEMVHDPEGNDLTATDRRLHPRADRGLVRQPGRAGRAARPRRRRRRDGGVRRRGGPQRARPRDRLGQLPDRAARPRLVRPRARQRGHPPGRRPRAADHGPAAADPRRARAQPARPPRVREGRLPPGARLRRGRRGLGRDGGTPLPPRPGLPAAHRAAAAAADRPGARPRGDALLPVARRRLPLHPAGARHASRSSPSGSPTPSAPAR